METKPTRILPLIAHGKRRQTTKYAYLPISMSNGELVWLKNYHCLQFLWIDKNFPHSAKRKWVTIERSSKPILNDQD